MPRAVANPPNPWESTHVDYLGEPPAATLQVYEEQAREAAPLRADKVVSAIEQSRGGRLYDPRIGHRMQGQGPRWAAIEALFAAHHRRLGFGEDREPRDDEVSSFRRPKAQQELFE